MLRSIIRGALVPRPSGPVRIRARGGLTFIVDPVSNVGLERALYYDGTYEEGTLAFLERMLRPGDTVIDVGAHFGLMSLVASRCVGSGGRVLSLEPQPENFSRLVRHIQLNGADSVVPLNAAVGATGGSGVIYRRERADTGSASMLPSGNPESHGSTVRMVSLDALCAEQRLESIRLVKIDVEGWELEVLQGATRLLSGSDAPIVVMECSSLHPLHGGERSDLFRFITSVNDYQVFTLARGKESPSRLVRMTSPALLPVHDNLFCMRPAHQR